VQTANGGLNGNRGLWQDRQFAQVPGNGKPLTQAEQQQAAAKSTKETNDQALANLRRGDLAGNRENKQGVDLSCYTNGLKCQTRVQQSPLRRVAERNCLEISGVWIDEGFDAKKPTVTVKAQSDAYFRILEKQPQKKWRPTNPNHRTRPQLLVELLTLVADWFPQRQFVVCVDTGYAGKSVLRHLPDNVDLLSQVHPHGVFYAPPPPPTGKRGARRKKGARLPDQQTWANDPASPWQTLVFDQYGLHAPLQVKVQQALYCTAGKDRLLTIILTRDTTGQRPDHRFS